MPSRPFDVSAARRERVPRDSIPKRDLGALGTEPEAIGVHGAEPRRYIQESAWGGLVYDYLAWKGRSLIAA